MTPEQFFSGKPDALHAYTLIAAIPPDEQFDPFRKVYSNAEWDAEIARCDAHNAHRAAQIEQTAQGFIERWPHPDTRARLRWDIEGYTLADWAMARTVQGVFEAASRLASERQEVSA